MCAVVKSESEFAQRNSVSKCVSQLFHSPALLSNLPCVLITYACYLLCPRAFSSNLLMSKRNASRLGEKQNNNEKVYNKKILCGQVCR